MHVKRNTKAFALQAARGYRKLHDFALRIPAVPEVGWVLLGAVLDIDVGAGGASALLPLDDTCLPPDRN